MTNQNIRYGYWHDFGVYAAGQAKDSVDEREICSKFGELSVHAYEYSGPGSFAFPICDSAGMFYDITSSQEEHGGTVFVKEFQQVRNHYFCVPWRSSEEISDVKPIKIDAEYIEILADFLHYVIEKSPVREIYIQIKRQGLERDNMIGMMTVEQFRQMMRGDELLGNVVYEIS